MLVVDAMNEAWTPKTPLPGRVARSASDASVQRRQTILSMTVWYALAAFARRETLNT